MNNYILYAMKIKINDLIRILVKLSFIETNLKNKRETKIL